ncbi:hypothetical protein ACFFIY_11560 [Bhargavaea ullalensis]|uniref:Type II secretory pathway pseudopilin PulG n=1 Tax=Bhargavaea ullalensis TaxID=1265685 RepID=A0ABV2G8L6_9BACL
MKKNHINEDGLSLVEVIASLALISIIIMGVMAFFTTAVKTNDTSETLLDASYVNQRYMEEIYQLADHTKDSERSAELGRAGWTKENSGGERYIREASGYYLELTITGAQPDSTLKNILLKVYRDPQHKRLASQMETKRQWEPK